MFYCQLSKKKKKKPLDSYEYDNIVFYWLIFIIVFLITNLGRL